MKKQHIKRLRVFIHSEKVNIFISSLVLFRNEICILRRKHSALYKFERIQRKEDKYWTLYKKRKEENKTKKGKSPVRLRQKPKNIEHCD